FARLEDEAAPLAQRGEFVHFGQVHGVFLGVRVPCIFWRAARRKPAVLNVDHGGLTPRRSPRMLAKTLVCWAFYFAQRRLTMPAAVTSSRSGSSRRSGT